MLPIKHFKESKMEEHKQQAYASCDSKKNNMFFHDVVFY